jgi:para-aminobenzoate synthetase component I
LTAAGDRLTGPAARRHTLCEEQRARVDCWRTARRLERETFLFLMDSAGDPPELGHYSILAWRPRWEFVAKDGVARAGPPGAAEPLAGPVLAELERTLAAFSAAVVGVSGQGDAPPVFKGGAVGFFAYELLHEIEAVTPSVAPDLGVADCHLLFCDLAVVTDELAGRSWIVGNGWGSTDAECRAECRTLLEAGRAACVGAEVRERRTAHDTGRKSRNGGEARERRAAPVHMAAGRRLQWRDLERHGVRALTAPERYLELVGRARERIFAGEVFELCLTQRFDADFDGAGIDLYEAMRAVSPAPMAAYLRYPELELLSCSPERFLQVDAERWVETRPIKGTRPRGRDALEDRALAADLATAPKDGAENVMIVDVARNDLGRVCEFGTISVPRLRAVERHPSVFQLVSTVRGRLRADTTPVQLLSAAFPGGSMTGAPKVAAMRLISAMEDSRRGVFAGSIGYINYSGELDLNVAIRTIVKRGEALSFHTGGAVTADSAPAAEYQETLDKACALVWAIAVARAAAGVGIGRAGAAAR